MSYGIKYGYQFTDRFGRLVETRILQRDYTGAIERIPTASGSSPLKMGRGRNEKSALSAIHATSVDFTIIANERFKYYDLYSYDEKAFKMEIDVAGNPHFVGWRIPDLYSEALRSIGPRSVNFTFSCGLGFLSDMSFDLTGKDTIVKVVCRILAKLELGLAIWWGATITGTHAANSTDSDLFNCDAYADKDCMEVIEIILAPLGLRIMQDGGVWRVEQIEDTRETQTFRVYNPDGNYLSTFTEDNNLTPNNTVDLVNGTCILSVDTATLNVQPIWKKFKFKQVYGYLKNFIVNGDFTKFTKTGKREATATYPNFPSGTYTATVVDDLVDIETWTNDDFVTQCPVIKKNNKTGGWIGLSNKAAVADLGANDFIIYTHGVSVVASAAERLRITLIFGIRKFTGGSTSDIYIEIKVGANYLRADGSWTPAVYWLKKSGNYPQDFSDMTGNTFDITSQNLPSGVLSIKLFKLVSGDGGDVMYLSATGEMVNVYGEKMAETHEEDIVVNNYANFEGADQTCEMGDAPAELVNALFYYKKVLSKADGTPTQTWNYKGIIGSLADQMKKRLLFFNLRPAFTIENTRLIGDKTAYKNCLNVAGRQFIFTGGSYDYKSSEWTGVTLAELPALPPSFSKLAAYFFRDSNGVIYDMISGLTGTITGTDIIWPDIAGYDVFDFSDPTFWNSALLPWYNVATPRKCPLLFLQGAAWAEAATDATHARLFHRDYITSVPDMLPVLIYKVALTVTEQAEVVKWLNWYFVITQGGDIIQQLTDTITQ
jgi:hypothetical protein